MITPKENYALAMSHQPAEWVPIRSVDCKNAGHEIWLEKGDPRREYDVFGVRWLRPEAGSGEPVTDPNQHLLTADTICDWEDILTEPNIDDCDFQAYADAMNARVDRDRIAIDFCSVSGPYERLAAFMGFEEALIAMVEEPEACRALCEWIVDYKIKVIERVAETYKPDYWTNFDDTATQLNLFMSAETYREVIKEPTRRYYQAVRDAGIVPITHCCGHAEAIIEDMIDEGAEAWSSVQPCNDIETLLQKYGDKFTIIGGFDSTGLPGSTDATDEDIERDVRRCIDVYGKYKSYIFQGFRMANSSDPEDVMREMRRIREPASRYAHEVAERLAEAV